jgi:hypothetical protein
VASTKSIIETFVSWSAKCPLLLSQTSAATTKKRVNTNKASGITKKNNALIAVSIKSFDKDKKENQHWGKKQAIL